MASTYSDLIKLNDETPKKRYKRTNLTKILENTLGSENEPESESVIELESEPAPELEPEIEPVAVVLSQLPKPYSNSNNNQVINQGSILKI
jgi:hypothetical protein